MTKQNLHIHTLYVDGKDSPEDMILEAIKRGFDSIGFSEHAYLPYSFYSSNFTPQKTEIYKNEIRALKQKYRGTIDIFCGLEYDFYSDVNTEDLDYLIGSVHYIECDSDMKLFDVGLEETLDYVQTNFGGDSLIFAKKYFEMVARLPEIKKFDIIGHFDLITKNNELGKFIDVSSKEYLNFGFEAIHALKNKIPFFEVNVGAVSRGYRTSPYPQMEFLKEFYRLGFGAIVTSDCHDKNILDDNFDKAFEFLRSGGFKSIWILTDDGFKETSI